MKKVLLLIAISFLLYECKDTLFEDSDSQNPNSHEPIVIYSHSDVYIDVIQRNAITSGAFITIALRPKKGSLKATDSIGVFVYTPDSSFLSGSDSMVFQIQLLTSEALTFDTVRVELRHPTDSSIACAGDPDPSFRDCFWETPPNFFESQVLFLNDRSIPQNLELTFNQNHCPEGSLLSIILTEPGPSHGTVELIGNNLIYHPDPTFSGQDQIDLQASYCGGNQEFTKPISIFIYDAICKPVSIPDTAYLHWDSDPDGQLLYTYENDLFCGSPLGYGSPEGLMLTLAQHAAHGSVTHYHKYDSGVAKQWILYIPNSGFTGYDSLRYRLTYNGINYTERVTMLVGQCVTPNVENDTLTAVDALPLSQLPDGSSMDPGTYYFDILSNDNMCDLTFEEMRVLVSPNSGTAYIENNLLKYVEAGNSEINISLSYEVQGFNPLSPHKKKSDSGNVFIKLD